MSSEGKKATESTAMLIKRELNVEKITPDIAQSLSISMESVKKIAEIKKEQMLAISLKKAVKEVIGTCKSMGIRVENKDPVEVQREIDEGKYDDILAE
ncbi:hypothetical protein DRN79_05040 [Methanosarcinales archaeon]|nr:MAG: hypothetical protein DRN79_05040 [Methanosarcinales archaeon]